MVEAVDLDLELCDPLVGLRRAVFQGPDPIFDPGDDGEAIWYPDGERFVYGNQAATIGNLYTKAANGVGEPTPLYMSPNDTWPTSISPDSRYFESPGGLFGSITGSTGLD